MVKKLNYLLLFLFIGVSNICIAQTYNDHFGTGNNVGISISSSDNDSINNPSKTLNGTGIYPDEIGASRFLAQASLGANYAEIQYVTQVGIENWIDEQISMNGTTFSETYDSVYNQVINIIPANLIHRGEYLSYTFYEQVLKQPDVLRHKVAFALSQIFVISHASSSLNSKGNWIANYYDLLHNSAFGNFRDLIENVSLHPAMGLYLSHFQNAKADITTGTYPDENYAREIMQLFSIGLYELNNDGSFKLNASGNSIPTYTNIDIQELSKIFTGLGSGATLDGSEPTFYTGISSTDPTVPMKFFDNLHDKTPKIMIDGTVIPGNQSGNADLNYALDVLYNHNNVGPFISLRLIQQLVKSNPTPAYINRVASVFNNNGNGTRGDLKAVVKAILIDNEARNCIWSNDVKTGKLLQPIERLTNLFKAFEISTPSGKLWFRDEVELEDELEQSFLNASSVFNFFTPFYAESDFVAPNNMLSPEFQILNSTSSLFYINIMEDAIKTKPFRNRTIANNNASSLSYNSNDNPILNFQPAIDIYNNEGKSALLDYLDLLLCRGNLQSNTKSIIINALTQYENTLTDFTDADAVKEALFFIMSTPDYTILK